MTRPLPCCPVHPRLRMSYGGNLLVCAHESHAAAGTHAQAITCLRCERTSYNPDDIRDGYCGHCHEWTSAGSGRT
jgi:hypothetical protein